MSGNRRFPFGAIILLLGAAVVFYQAWAVSALSINEPKMQDSILNNQVEENLSASETFEQLNQKILIAVRSGWLHGREHRVYDVDSSNFGVLPNGQEIPLEQITDFWFYVNDNGFIERSITITHTKDGQVVQVGVNSNGTSWNTAINEIVPHELFLWGYGFDYGLHYYLDSPTLQYSLSLDQNGRPSIAFVISVQEEKPAPVQEYSSSILAMDHYYYFDAETGFLTRTYSIAHLEDGSQRYFEDIQVEFFIGTTPPPDVLAYFEQKHIRESEK
ncbi:MAG: hypothetical protein QY302_13640 [Anaerolineales bacterium]|nr:MAG: hypothetical protein QY302_13640 [Anaerolineales bacterium]